MADPVLPPIPQQRMAAQYTNMQACVRCGLCNSVCPTYQQSFLEYEGPRGRIAMAKALVEGHLDITDDLVAHWDTCILCDACSAICPAGVRMEPIGQSLRAAVGETKGYAHGRVMNALLRWALPNLKVLRAAVTLGGVYQRTGLGRLARSLGLEQALGLAELVEMLPPVESEPLVPSGQVWEPVGEHRATVALLAGCYMSAVFGETDRATARVLAANGCRVIVPAGQGCCGSLHAHRGELATAHELARRNIDAFERAQVDAIVVNAAGCGNTLKHYGAYLSDDPSYEAKAAAFANKVRDFSEFLMELGPRPPQRALPWRVTYQEPCHLANAQRVREAPRALLRLLPGLELREMREPSLCCGAGAMYNLTQPESSLGLRERKLRNAEATEAEVIVTANPGCHVQLGQGLRESGAPMRVMHIADVLDQAYR